MLKKHSTEIIATDYLVWLVRSHWTFVACLHYQHSKNMLKTSFSRSYVTD